MLYFVTGASGFHRQKVCPQNSGAPGRAHFRPVARRVRRRSSTAARILRRYRQTHRRRAGDITADKLGVATKDARKLKGKIDHVVHLAAIYDPTADPQDVLRANVEGARNALGFARHGRSCFHLVSSIAAAGPLRGRVPRRHVRGGARPRTSHISRASTKPNASCAEQKVAWRIYRPGIVVGDSRTGEMDKVDGPYYFFVIQKLRALLPPWR